MGNQNSLKKMENIPKTGTDSQIIKPQGLCTILAQRFPHLTEAMFDQLDNQTLATCRNVSRPWYTQQNFLKFRTILSDIKKFHKVGDCLLYTSDAADE